MESSSSTATPTEMASSKPLPKDLTHYLSVTAAARKPSVMKQYYRYFQIPGIGNLAGGLPNLRFFPFDTLEAQTAKPERWTPTPNEPPSAAAAGDDDDDDDSQLAAQAAAALRIGTASGKKGKAGDGGDTDDMAASHITVPKAMADDTDAVRKIDLATALQYGTAQGYPPLLSFLRQFTRENMHPNVPYEGGPDVCLTVGSTDGFSKTMEMFVDPWSPARDDVRDRPGLLCETFVYGTILNQCEPRGVQVVPCRADAGGMVATGPGSLEDVLANWDYARGRRPHLMYTVTMGHNPTGVLLSLERRRALYAVCSRFDVIIVEDDPYWYLQFPSAAAEEARSRGRPPVADAFSEPYRPARSSGYPYLDSLVPSFLSLDTDGRVVRLDTFSKTVAPGCRLGWITAQPDLVERYVRVTETSTQQPSGFVQSVISELVLGAQPAAATSSWLSLRGGPRERAAFGGWQTDGWVRWIEGLRGMYERRMVRMCRILDGGAVHVRQGTPRAAADADADLCVLTTARLYDFAWPRGGMFVWVRVFLEDHPLYGAASSDGRGLVDGPALGAGLLLFLTRRPHLVLVSPGTTFSSTDDVRRELGWRYFRLCFAAESEENVDACSRRFARGVRKYWGLRRVEELEDLIRDSPMQKPAGEGGADEDAAEPLGNLGPYMGC